MERELSLGFSLAYTFETGEAIQIDRDDIFLLRNFFGGLIAGSIQMAFHGIISRRLYRRDLGLGELDGLFHFT